MKKSVLVIVSMALTPCWAFAQNGVVLINQSTVAGSGANRATGGFPYTITQPGSYQLSSNLTVPAGVNGIQITASFVSLDLNGFNISCAGSCSGYGITDNSTPQSGITIRNGSVLGFKIGIDLVTSTGSLIEKVTTQSNTTGIAVGNSSTIKDFNISCIGTCSGFGIYDNGTQQSGITIRNGTVFGFVSGIDLNASIGSFIEKVTAQSNANNGIVVGNSSTIKDCTALNNGQDGIEANLHSIVSGSVASGNGSTGIFVATGTLTGNTADSNFNGIVASPGSSTLTGNTASNNTLNGIATDIGCTLTGNTATANKFGFNANLGSNLTGNTATGNSAIAFIVQRPANLVGNAALNTGLDATSLALCNRVNNLGF